MKSERSKAQEKARQALSFFLLTSIVGFACCASLLKILLNKNFETFIDVAAVLVGLGCLGLKMAMLMVKRKEIEVCLEKFHELEIYDEMGILGKYDEKIFSFVKFFTIFEFVVASIYIFVALVWNGNAFILPFPVEIDNEIFRNIIVAFQVYQGLASSILSGLIESIIVTFFANFHAHLECLSIKMKTLTNESFKNSIEYHVKLLDLFTSIEKCFAEAIFIQSNAMTIILCTLAFQLTTISPMENPQITCKIFGVICAMFSQIFLPFYIGSVVAEKSLEISQMAYTSKWYEGDKKFRKNVLFIMMMSQKEIRMNILGFNHMNLGSFLKVIKNLSQNLWLFSKFFFLIDCWFNLLVLLFIKSVVNLENSFNEPHAYALNSLSH